MFNRLKLHIISIISTLFCIALPVEFYCQTTSLYSTDNGLASSLINKVYQDSEGYIWVATEYGLNKFEGNQFTTYKHIEGDQTSLKDSYVRTIFEDSKENLYIGTIAGLMHYDRGTDSFIEITLTKDDKIVQPHITSIIETQNGDIWFTTSGQGIFSDTNGDRIFKGHSELSASLNSIFLNSIFEDSDANLWIGSENEGLNLYNPRTSKLTSFNAPDKINSNNISAIYQDLDGDIYVGTLTKGLSKYNAIEDKFIPIRYKGSSQFFVKSIVSDENNKLLIGTDGQGLMYYNRKKDVIEDYELVSTPFDFSKAKVHSILLDRDNNIWLGCFQRGLFFIPTSKSKFTYIGYKSLDNNIIGSNPVTAIYKDRKDITWIGTDNDGIYGINDEGKRLVHYQKTTSPTSAPNIIHSIIEGPNNDLWIGSYTDGLAKLNTSNGSCQYIDFFSDKKVYCISYNNDENLLVGTYGSGFYIVDKNGKVIERHESSKREMDILSIDELSNDWINTLMCDKDNLIWIGHFKGLSCYDPIKKTFLNFFDKNNILTKTMVHHLIEDKEGIIWIGATTGLYSFNKKTKAFKHFTTKNGLTNNVICGIAEDDQGNIWISTYHGINKLKKGTEHFINYYASDGLQGNEFSRGVAFKDKENKIYFGGTHGVSSFFPKDIIEEKRELNISLTNFYVYNKSINKEDQSNKVDLSNRSFTLEHDENTFSLEFTTFDYANSKRIAYQYMIEGIDSEWLSTSNGINRITYNNLAPDKYILHVRAHDNNSFSPIETFQIRVTPPWYKSVFAYVLYLILIILAIFGIIAHISSRILYKEKLMEKEHAEKVSEAKLQFFINISHEIRTPMTLIINPIEKLIKENSDPAKNKTYLMIHRNSQRILRLINQLMDIRKLDKGQMKLNCRETDLVGFIDDLMLTFEYLAKKKNINFTFKHDAQALMVWIDLNNFDKVLLNILSNAFKYTPDHGNIGVSLKVTKNEKDLTDTTQYFEIVIADTGIGIDKNQIENIFERFYQINNDQTNSNFGTGIGLHLARLLIEMHHGVLYAENREDVQGSRFIIRVPMGNSHLDPSELETAQTEPVTNPQRLTIENIEVSDDISEAELKRQRPKTKYKLLVVEDEDEIRKYLHDEFADSYKILEAKNGKEALEIVMNENIDLIISDVMMPEMDGITLSKKIRQNININHIPIILLTAKAKPEHKIEGLEIGADAYLTKPFNTDILRQTITNLIENRELLRNVFGGNQHQDDKIEKIAIKSSDEVLIERIMKVINDNLSNPELNVEMLAQNVGMSRVHMHRKLKELTNQSARDFIRNIRLKQAGALLASKKSSVSEVAYSVGFVNLSHFSNSFKEFYGMSPSDYASKNMDEGEN